VNGDGKDQTKAADLVDLVSSLCRGPVEENDEDVARRLGPHHEKKKTCAGGLVKYGGKSRRHRSIPAGGRTEGRALGGNWFRSPARGPE